MREIKFRAWVKETKDMVYPDRLTNLSGNMKSEDESAVLMQYTGLKDKNGKEIYEGDILIDEEGCKAIVSYFQGAFSADFNKPNKFPALLYNYTYMKIIGNVWENSDLLTI